MSEAVEEASEEILEGATEVAEGVAQMARGFSGLALSGAFLLGAGMGGAAGYFFCKRQLETKYKQIADEEIDEMRAHYHAKAVAAEEKGDLESIVKERGYAPETSAEPPMAVTPPAAVVERAEEVEEEEAGAVVVEETPRVEVQNVFEQHGDDTRTEGEWDWHKERRNRSPNRPYVIHIDEREEYDTYDGVTWTYYEEDDVLCNELDEVVDKTEREKLIGEANLNRFGHGSNDPSVVYIRNDKLEMVIEVCQSPNSYAEEVHGFAPEPEIRHSDRRRGRSAFDDE